MINDKRTERIDESLSRKQPKLQVMLDDVHSSQNLSAIIRSCDAVGVLDIYYSSPENETLRIHKTITQVATGGSLADAIEFVKKHEPKKIISLNIIAAPEGLEVIEKLHSDIDLFIAQIDEKLNDDKFIIPGLGDAGDRAYNTPQ